jgi:dTMP kinase
MSGDAGMSSPGAVPAFITLEGGEGVGKSTQAAILAERLAEAGRTVRLLREPGGTGLGDAVRELLLATDGPSLDAWTELLLYEASRSQLIVERIRPALAAGEVVVCDRFCDSTLAYQGYGRKLDLDAVRELNRRGAHGIVPDLTIVLDLPVALGIGRATTRGADRLESEDTEFHERVREGFLSIAAAEPGRVRVVRALGAPEEVADEIWGHVRRSSAGQPGAE